MPASLYRPWNRSYAITPLAGRPGARSGGGDDNVARRAAEQLEGVSPLVDAHEASQAVGVALAAVTDVLALAASRTGATAAATLQDVSLADTAHELKMGACEAVPIEQIFDAQFDGALITAPRSRDDGPHRLYRGKNL